MLLPRASKVLEYLRRVVAAALQFATLALALLHADKGPAAAAAGDARPLLVRELKDCFAAFTQDLT
jgi:hypothetical protein